MVFITIPLATLCSAANPITVQIVNDSSVGGQHVQDSDVYVLLTGKGVPSATGITPNVSTKLSALANDEFTLNSVSAGRITFSFNGPVAENQQPLDPSDRFDKVELTYPGAANLTAVDFFAIPFELETLDSHGDVLQKLTYYASADSIVKKLKALVPNSAPDPVVETPRNSFARILSPALSPDSYPDMQSYVKSVEHKKVTIKGTYVGPVAPSPNTYNYSGTFGSDGSITLTGRMGQPATPAQQPLTIDGSTLASAIYTDNGSYSVATATNNPQNVSNNDVYAAIYRDLIAGFDFGYVGGKYGDDSAMWYGTTPYHPPYACARRSNDGFYNQYAAVIAANSDAYGFPFSDRLQPVQAALNPGTSGDVATLRITILPDDAMDAPIIQFESATDNSITVRWGSVKSATDYKLNVSPPLPAKVFDAGGSTHYTISDLNPGTPYTVSVTASNGTSTSEAIPIVISTQGQAQKVTGAVTWNFIPNFTGKFPAGEEITFNGVTKDLPTTKNPALQFNSVHGIPGATNAYVFKWTKTEGSTQKLIYSSILYVDLQGTPATGNGAINQAAADTFMAANQHLPTYQNGVPFNLFLSIDPSIQRTLCIKPEPLLRSGNSQWRSVRAARD